MIPSYFVPEDGDLESQPNVFLAPKPKHPNTPPTFGQVRNAFPLPGQYHFRFKSALVPGSDREKSAMAVWMDVVEERQPVPTWRNSIVVKVSRISMEDDDDDDDDDDFGTPTPVTRAPPAPTPVPRAPPSHGSAVSAGSIDDLFGAAPAPAAPPAAAGGSLLDFNDHHQPQQPSSAAHNDFFGMTAHPPAAQQAHPSGIKSAPSSGGYHGNPNMYAQQQQHIPAPQQQTFNYSAQQKQQGAFDGLGIL